MLKQSRFIQLAIELRVKETKVGLLVVMVHLLLNVLSLFDFTSSGISGFGLVILTNDQANTSLECFSLKVPPKFGFLNCITFQIMYADLNWT